MNKIKLGIIGAGGMAKQHLKVLKDMDNVELTGITSRTLSKAEDVAKEYSISKVYPDVEALVREGKVQALLVLVSEDQMTKVVSQVIPYKLPLFIEKPAGLTPEDNLKLAKLADEYKVKTFVGYNRRFYSIFHKGLEIIKQHGPLLGVQVEGHERMWRIRAGGKYADVTFRNWIYANSTHTIDLLRLFAGDVKKVNSVAKSIHEPGADQMSASIEFTSGAIGTYISHWYSPGGWKVVLYGDGVTVEFKPLEKGVWIDKKFDIHEIEVDEIDTKYKAGFYRQMESFVKLVKEGKSDWPVLDLAGAHKTMVLAQQISKL